SARRVLVARRRKTSNRCRHFVTELVRAISPKSHDFGYEFATRERPAEQPAARAVSFASALRERLGVIVRRVADDRVNVARAALRGVFNQERRTLDAVIGGAAVGGRTIPAKICVVQ